METIPELQSYAEKIDTIIGKLESQKGVDQFNDIWIEMRVTSLKVEKEKVEHRICEIRVSNIDSVV